MSCVLAPACSATAVREPLVLTGKPWKNPAATLAAPMPIISPLPSTSCPVRAANADAVEIVSVSETSAMPSAPATSSGRSDTGRRHRERREPLGQRPDQRDPVVGEVEGARGGDRDDHGDQHAWDRAEATDGAPGSAQAEEPDRDGGADRFP